MRGELMSLHLKLPTTSSSSFRCKSNRGCFKQDGLHSSKKLELTRGNKLLKDLSTWAIGGPCKFFLSVSSHTHLLSAIRFHFNFIFIFNLDLDLNGFHCSYCRQRSIPYIVIGKGSNCLFDDLGFDGCVILNRIEFLERIEKGVYRVGSGFPFNRLGALCSNEGFSGLEFAVGVPATVGGAAFMNAGANTQETCDTIESVEIVTNGGELQTLQRSELEFGYRSSPFQQMKDLGAIVAVTFKLQPSSSARATQQHILATRRASQPLGDRTAGSVFRNPPDSGVAAAELIDKAGLKGFRVGGAMVSNVHANFFVNVGGSTSRDMLQLIGLVKEKVDCQFGIQLKEEVLYISPHMPFPQH